MSEPVRLRDVTLGQVLSVPTDPCVIGRSPECDVCIDDQRISRRHARLVRSAEGLQLEDLGSANGTYVNGRRVLGQATLANGDAVTFGKRTFQLEIPRTSNPHSPSGRVTIVDNQGPGARVIEVANIPSLSASDGGTRTQRVRLDHAREVERLDHKLRTIYRVSEAVASAARPRELLEGVVLQLLEVFPQASEATAVARDRRSGELDTMAIQRRGEGTPRASASLPRGVIDRVLRQGHSVLLRPAGDGARVTALPLPPHATVLGHRMGAPMTFKGEPLGILHVEADPADGAFDQADLDLLGGIAAQIGVALQLAAMHEKLVVRERLDKDLTIARQIQRNLLPREPPRLTGMEFAVHYEPAFHVGGDFFDFLWLDPKTLGVVVGDVSGKAISGALFMARVASEIRAQATLRREPHKILESVNRAIAEATHDGVFCTAVMVSIDLERHVLRFSNAGHPAPLLRRDGSILAVEAPDARSLPLGIEPEIRIGEGEIALRPGDSLLICTDGVLEAHDADGSDFGNPRLVEAMLRAGDGAGELLRGVLGDVDRFAPDGLQSDDQTVVTLHVTAERSQVCESAFPPPGEGG